MEAGLFDSVAEQFADFHLRFASLFGNTVSRERSAQYLVGLLLERGRRNIENLIDVVPHVSAHALERFITYSSWAWEPVITALQVFYGERLASPDGVFVLDDTGFGKQGTHSVGVARQYSGTLGKVGNCQIGVFLTYVSPRGFALVDGRLYLPAAWTDDPQRCEAAGVPESARGYQAKTDLGLTLIREARRRGALPGRWVTADAAYGDSPSFRDGLEADGLWYVVEMACTTPFFQAPAQTHVPEWSGHGRKPSKAQLAEGRPGPRTLREIVASVPETQWQRCTVAEGEQGPRTYEFWACRGWESREGVPGRPSWLIARRNLDGSELKYYQSNAPASTPLQQMAWVSAMRWCAETSYEQAKTEGGLDEYEVRTWPGWYHHITLVLLVMAFLLLLTQEWGEKGVGLDAAGGALGGATAHAHAGVDAHANY